MIKLFLEENKHNERKFYGSYSNEQEARKAIIEYSEKHGYHRPFWTCYTCPKSNEIHIDFGSWSTFFIMVNEGKGLMTDYFASKEDNAIVVLHNGGAQRGHTVITPEGYRHVFRHFGSGAYVGAATYIAKEFIVNPILFRQEYEKLAKHGRVPKVYINKKCKLTTIYDMLINQVLEADRGINKHGSCGVGVFETIYRNKDGVDFKNPVNINPAAMTVGEFMRLSVLNKIDFLDYLRKNYVPKRFDDFGLKNISVEFMNVLTSNAVIMNFIDDFEFMIEHSKWANDDILNYYDNVIFEGGQGLLLDQYNMDYFPHLTPSNTGMKNPTTILNALDYKGEVEVCYVTRSYMTRHGVGRFDTECEKKNINPNMIDITNVPNIFQDSLRYGYLDYNELKERILKDVNNNPLKSIVKISLAITHMNEYKIELKDEKIFDNCYISTGYTRTSVY